MRIAEKILAITTLIGLTLMFLIISSGLTIFLISLLTLSGIYFAFGFILFNEIRLRDVTKKETFANLTAIRIVFGAITGLALSIISVGALFKLLNLPGSGEMLMAGVFITLLISIAAIIMRHKVSATTILIRTIIFGAVGIILIFTSTLSIVKLQYRNYPAYVEAYTQYVENPREESLWEKQKLEYNRVWMSEEEFKKYEAGVSEP
jgi:hypothetical protein